MRYLFVLLLAGCATQTEMIKVAELGDVAVYWFRVEPVCDAVEPGCYSTVVADHANGVCRITALESVPDGILGREFRRCFGYVHADDSQRHPATVYRAPNDFGGDMIKVAEPRSVWVFWRREAPTPQTCRNPRLPGVVPSACTVVADDHSRCRVIASEAASDSLLGHELRHCFGWKHAADLQWREQAK